MLSHYINQFSNLKRATFDGDKAPHKPILLLSIIQLMDDSKITENKVFITSELEATFNNIWNKLVTNPKFIPKLYLPFFHLQSGQFWHLHPYPGKEVILTTSDSIRSFKQLKEAVKYASFDRELFILLMNDNNRYALKQTLMQLYFP